MSVKLSLNENTNDCNTAENFKTKPIIWKISEEDDLDAPPNENDNSNEAEDIIMNDIEKTDDVKICDDECQDEDDKNEKSASEKDKIKERQEILRRFNPSQKRERDEYCSECQLLFIEPATHSICKKEACSLCLRTGWNCPFCNEKVSMEDLIPAKPVWLKTIYNTMGNCADCSKAMTWKTYWTHVDEDCKFECPDKCGSEVSRATLTLHKNQCPNHCVKCRNYEYGCTIKLPRRHMQEHENQCEFIKLVPFIRDNQLRDTRMRNMEMMLRNIFTHLTPDNHDIVLNKSDMENTQNNHMKSNSSTITDYLIDMIEQYTSRVENELKKENTTLQATIDNVETKINNHMNTNQENLNAQLNRINNNYEQLSKSIEDLKDSFIRVEHLLDGLEIVDD